MMPNCAAQQNCASAQPARACCFSMESKARSKLLLSIKFSAFRCFENWLDLAALRARLSEVGCDVTAGKVRPRKSAQTVTGCGYRVPGASFWECSIEKR